MFERNKFLLVARHCFIMHAIIKTLDLIDQETPTPDVNDLHEDIFALGNLYFNTAPAAICSLHISPIKDVKEKMAFGDILQATEEITNLFQSTNSDLKKSIHRWLMVSEPKRLNALNKMIPEIDKCIAIDKCIRRIEFGWIDRSDLY